MQVITAKEFSDNQQKYFDMAEQEPVFVTRENARPIVIDIADDDLTEKEIRAIQKGHEDIQAGRTTRIKDIHNIWESIL